jgi:hypothetical protein
MKKLFNRTFVRFTLGFASILLASFMLAAVVSHLDTQQGMSASVSGGE